MSCPNVATAHVVEADAPTGTECEDASILSYLLQMLNGVEGIFMLNKTSFGFGT